MSDLKPYTGETLPATSITSELGKRSNQESSIHNLLLDYGWAVPVAVGAAYGISKMFQGNPPDNPPPPGLGTEEKPFFRKVRDRFIGQPSTPPGPETSIEKQLGGLDINTLPKDQRELINTLNDAERKRIAKQQTAINAINDASKGKIPLPENTTPTIDLASPIKTTAPVAPVIAPNLDVFDTIKGLLQESRKFLEPKPPVLAPAPNMVGSVAPVLAPEVPTVADIGKQAVGVAPVEPPTTTTQIATEAVEGKKKGRPTKAEAEAKAAAQAAFIPPPEAQKIPEKWGKGMGWLVGAYGVDGAQDFINRYNNGKPFESYADFTKKYEQLTGKAAGSVGELYGPTFGSIPKEVRKERGIVPSAPQFKKEAGYAIPQPIPGKQTGSGSLGSILGALASGGLMYAGTTPEAQAAMQRAGTAIRDIGISPDIMQGKGEELGRLGSAYVKAGNPQYRQQLLQQINVETDPVRYNMLLSEFMKAGGNVPGGRGAVVPPQ